MRGGHWYKMTNIGTVLFGRRFGVLIDIRISNSAKYYIRI